MIDRRIHNHLIGLLNSNPVVGLLRPRQVGKTTLALEIASQQPSLYLDLVLASSRARLADPEGYLSEHEDKLVILDEVHRVPELFQTLTARASKSKFLSVCHHLAQN